MFHPQRKGEKLKNVRASRQQVQSLKCSNEISCQGNHNGYHFCYSILLNGFVFVAELNRPSEFEKYLACDVYLVCVTQKT